MFKLSTSALLDSRKPANSKNIASEHGVCSMAPHDGGYIRSINNGNPILHFPYLPCGSDSISSNAVIIGKVTLSLKASHSEEYAFPKPET